MKPPGAIPAVGAVALLLSGCAGSSIAAPPPSAGSVAPQSIPARSTTQVDITDFAFTPARLSVPVGTTVTWTNHDDEPHTVVARDGSFRSAALDTDDTYRFTVTAPGSFDYFCSIHPMMTATLVVTP